MRTQYRAVPICTLFHRLALVAGIGGSSAVYTALFWPVIAGVSHQTDFWQLWTGAHVLLRGESPYALIGPGHALDAPFPLYYPLPAVVAAIPFSVLPLWLAEAVFVGVGATLLAWVLTRDRLAHPALLVFPSFAMMAVAQNVQWSPILIGAVGLPSLGFLLACKPTMAAALWIAYPSRRALLLAGGFTLATVLVWPWWVMEWLATLPTATHITAPVLRRGGPVLLLALLCWRRQDARLLLALACVPQTANLYEAVPLFLLVQTLPQGLLLFSTSIIGGQVTTLFASRAATFAQWSDVNGAVMLLTMYLPCLVMVLRRPNEWPLLRPIPARRVARVPEAAR